MNARIEDLESEISRLPEDVRAQLLGRLLQSFATQATPDDVLQAWAEEADRRDRAMSSGEDTGLPADEVLDRLK